MNLKEIYGKIYYESLDSSVNLINENDIVKIVSYLTFLETFWTMYQRGIISISMINDLFANRFFMMITNKSIQELKLVKEYDKYQNIRQLEQVWRKFRIDNKLENLYSFNSLNKAISIKVARDLFMAKNKSSKYIFKNILESDLEEVMRLQDSVINDLDEMDHLYKTPKDTFKELLSSGENICCGVFNEGKLIAYSFFVFKKKNFLVYKKRFTFPKLHKDNIYFKVAVVDKPYRNQGIHTVFLEVVKEYAKYYKINRIIATVHPKNTISCHVFDNNNFTLVKVKKVHDNKIRNIYEYRPQNNRGKNN